MNTILIDKGAATEPSLLFQNPVKIITAYCAKEVEQSLQDIERYNNDSYHIAGFFSYELGYLLEKKLEKLTPKNSAFPFLKLGVYERPHYLNQSEVDNWLSSQNLNQSKNEYSIKEINLSQDQSTYEKAFNKAIDKIISGDIYQLNLTFHSNFKFSGNPYQLYKELKQKQRMAHGAVISMDDYTILSASPELFISIHNNKIITKPMKGTARRGYSFDHDNEVKDWLKTDEKSQAENLMILDLMRNDISRISEIGSVEVTKYFSVETFPTLHQMISEVTGKLKKNLTISELLKALFPPGSITGAPKVRAMEIINELEQQPRGIYTGTIGYFEPKRTTETFPNTYFNVAIRTVCIKENGIGTLGIGSGVVSDSKAASEYDECRLKMKFLTEKTNDFQLIETMAFIPDKGYLYYKHHLQRLSKSADYFQYKLSLEQIEEKLETLKTEISDATHMVRLLLSENGKVDITAKVFEVPSSSKIMKFVISDQRMNSRNIFLYHKTTNRAFYDDEHKVQTSKHKCDEVIFLNEREELTEGSRTNLFIEKHNKIFTPPIESGLLAGTLRQSLLEERKIIEKKLSRDDLENADKIYLGNSVRGLLIAEKIKTA